MNKKLVAVAIAGLLAAPLAQAQTANVTLYGRVNIDMEFVNGRLANNTNPTVYRVSSNSSRFGIRGTESLGGGLNAIFQIENGSIRPTTADGGQMAGRDSFVGLSGGWGTVKVGRFLAPYDDIHGIFGNDNTYSTSILSTAAIWAQGFAGQPGSGGFDDRLQQSIRYDTPSMSGFKLQMQFFTNGAATLGAGACTSGNPNLACNAPASNANGYSLSGGYANGPFQGLVAYEAHNRTRIGGTGATGTLVPLSDWAFSVAAKWQFSQFNIAGVYEKMEYEVQNGAVVNKLKRNSFWGLDTTINVGANGQLFVFYGQAGNGTGSATVTAQPVITATKVTSDNTSRVAGLARGDQTGASQWEVSYSYDLSKRTKIYTGYVKINNDNNASYTFNINSYNVSAGGSPGGFVMGMGHSF